MASNKQGKKRDKSGSGKSKKGGVPHRFHLYSAAVQSVDADIDFFRRVYRSKRGESFRRLREDFCGTALLAHDWVRRKKHNEAWGVDLDRKTLDWGRKHYTPVIGEAAERLHMIEGDVTTTETPKVDMVVGLNFSYSVFKSREMLGRYFRQARESLADGGLFVIDAWGGFDVITEDIEHRKIDRSKTFDGVKVPAFKYIWEQVRFNPVDHAIRCRISFELKGGKKMRNAFTYDWRLWTLPELQELMLDAGFSSTEVYVEGWDDEADDTDGIFRRRKYFENQAGWVAYVIGVL